MDSLPRQQASVARRQVDTLLDRLVEHEEGLCYPATIRLAAALLELDEARAEATVARMLAARQLGRRGDRIVVND